jgi:hypothetical protein
VKLVDEETGSSKKHVRNISSSFKSVIDFFPLPPIRCRLTDVSQKDVVFEVARVGDDELVFRDRSRHGSATN